jgi:hypothetical protein
LNIFVHLFWLKIVDLFSRFYSKKKIKKNYSEPALS